MGISRALSMSSPAPVFTSQKTTIFFPDVKKTFLGVKPPWPRGGVVGLFVVFLFNQPNTKNNIYKAITFT